MIKKKDDGSNRTHAVRHEKNISTPFLQKDFNDQINERASNSRPQSISGNLSHQSNPVGPTCSESRNRYSNDVRNIYGALPDLRMESKCKENLTRTVLKFFEKECRLFTGTHSRSWAMHLETFIELAETLEVRNNETLLQLIRWTQVQDPRWYGINSNLNPTIH